MKILLVEDDEALAMGICYALEAEGMEVISASDFASVRDIFEDARDPKKKEDRKPEKRFDLVLLDVMLPDVDGFTVCRWIKEKSSDIAVIFLTALEDEGNVVHGLDVGGDDYVTKPFRTKELVARIRANVRKKAVKMQAEPLNTEIRLDENEFCARRGGERILLTPSEFKLLRELMANPGRVLPRELLMEKLWSVDEAFVDDNTLSVYIRRLRQKIDRAGQESHIKTVRGIGYRWQV